MTHKTIPRAVRLRAAFLLLPLAAACTVERSGADASDTARVPIVSHADTAGGATASGALPAGQSWMLTSGDTGRIRLAPPVPKRGGVAWMLAESIGTPPAHCAFKGRDLPCYTQSTGVVAVLPLSAREPAGVYTFQVDQPETNGRPFAIAGKIQFADHDFGREVVLLDSAHYALTQRGADVARDARVLRQLLATESPVRYWTTRWRDPVQGTGTGYGALRYYYPASDSSRAIPVANDSMSAPFGLDTTIRTSGVPSWRHAGTDIAAAKGTAVIAPADGVVLRTGEFTLTGRTLIVDHGQGILTAYFHLDTISVKEGDRVTQGERMAKVGDTGLATGPHLHYGVYVHGSDVDPAILRDIPAWVVADSVRGSSTSKPAAGMKPSTH